jgi:hypothetical protein
MNPLKESCYRDVRGMLEGCQWYVRGVGPFQVQDQVPWCFLDATPLQRVHLLLARLTHVFVVALQHLTLDVELEGLFD